MKRLVNLCIDSDAFWMFAALTVGYIIGKYS